MTPKNIFLVTFLTFFVSVVSFLVGRISNSKSNLKESEEGLYEIFPTQYVATISPSHTPSETTAPKAKTPTGSITLTPTLISKSKILTAEPGLDGYRNSNGSGNSQAEIKVGRNANFVSRGFAGFDITNIPSDSKVIRATLRLYQEYTTGNPYSEGGSIKIDHLTYGESIDINDYGLPALSSTFNTISTNTKKEWKEADVTSRVKDDLANSRNYSEYRIHFQTEVTDDKSNGDFAYFESAENQFNTNNSPQLIIKYY